MFPIRWNFPFRKKDGSLSTIGDEIESGGGGGGYTLPTASAETKGGVKIGSGLTMTGEVLSNNNPTPYSLPTASAETLGGVKIGTGLTMTEGVLSNNNPTQYVLPTASDQTLGGVKVGSGLTMTEGVLSNSNPTPYSLPTATDQILGGVKVGSGLAMTDGVLSNSNPLPTQSDITLMNANTTYSHLKVSKSGNIVEITGFIILTNELDVGDRIQVSQAGIPSDDRLEGGWFPMAVTMSDENVTKFTIATLTAYTNGNLFVNNNFADVKAKYLYVSCRYRIGDYTLH